MANELRVSGSRAYIERETPDLIVSGARVYIELISNEIRVSSTQIYIERTTPKLSVSGVGVYIENRKNENNFVLQMNGSIISGIKNFTYNVSVNTIDTTNLASATFQHIPNYSDTFVSFSGSWYKELDDLISIGETLSSFAVQIVDRFNFELQLSLLNAFMTNYKVEFSIDSEITFEIDVVGENNG